MSDEPVLVDDEELDEDEEAPELVGTPLVVPELDLQGGTVFKVGDQEFATMEEAQEAADAAGGEEEPDVEEEPTEE